VRATAEADATVRSASPGCGRAPAGSAYVVVPVVPVYASPPTIREATPVPDHRQPPTERTAWRFAIQTLIWVVSLALFAAVVFLFVGVMREPVGAEPGRGVVTIPAPGPSGGVR
jgi:uncharacterized membrane protein YdbT with pleckstrin-like domain